MLFLNSNFISLKSLKMVETGRFKKKETKEGKSNKVSISGGGGG